MAGPDDVGWRSELEANSERLGINSRVHWTGMLRGPEKWGALYGAEAFILPSHQENFGIAVAEALFCGVIPLMSDKINIARDIAAEGAGIMEPDTLDGTRRLIQRFCDLSEAEKCLMRTRSLACHQNRYALRNAAQEVYRALGMGETKCDENQESGLQ
jgi:glycosyltransferase involved in cell wall biosynthesis